MRTFAAGLAGLVLALSSTIHAVTVLPATFEELVQESVTVVHGRVTGVDAHWSADRRTIESTVTLAVTEDDATAAATAGLSGPVALVLRP